jgi:hypothetical protein
MKVNCPYLNGGHPLFCRVDQTVYVPSIRELDEYCENRRHTQCPFYQVSVIERHAEPTDHVDGR